MSHYKYFLTFLALTFCGYASYTDLKTQKILNLQWSATRHAFAYQTLQKKERYFDAGCVSCHTTGFGYSTGFQIGDPDSTLEGVQCETCHGPGKQHVGNPKNTNIRRGNDTTRNIRPVSLKSRNCTRRIRCQGTTYSRYRRWEFVVSTSNAPLLDAGAWQSSGGLRSVS